ncbi:MAG: arylsulfatase [Verrucomicrobiales bacterium]|nr:arylsulfatase [Verrucomicrobiales bacterium]
MLRCLLAVLLAWVSTVASPAQLAGRRPNLIVILTDDQGYGDLSAHGNPVLQTPYLDRLHREGARFTDFHVSPTCAPTRAALWTGRHEFRSGVSHTILERERLALEAVTLADVLRRAGYATGIFGKWHLGDEKRHRPDRRGFEEILIHGGGGIGQTYPGSCGDVSGNAYQDPVLLHNRRFEKTSGYCTDVYFSRAMAWMDRVRPRRPFLAYISCNAPHVPWQVRAEDAARYEGRVKPPLEKFMGMVANIDDNVGRLLDWLEARGLERETLVIFMTDNGADGGSMVFNAGMRGKKGTAYLGGTRAVSLWRWSGMIKPGDRRGLTAHLDVFPTLVELTGARVSRRVREGWDGRSLVPLLERDGADWPERTLFTHVGRWPKGTPPEHWKYKACSVRESRWQMVSADGGREPRWQLFDVGTDPGQQRDVSASQPEVVARLAARYEVWWADVRVGLVNEDVPLAETNPFKVEAWRQFGGGPTEEDRRLMDVRFNPATAPGPAR